MQTGTYKGKPVKIYESGDEYIIEFPSGDSITMDDLSEVDEIHNTQMNYSREEVQELFDKYNSQIDRFGLLDTEHYSFLKEWRDKNI